MQTLKTKPVWIGPFKIQKFNHWFNNYSLDFSEHPELQLLHNNFHISVLKPYHRNDPAKFSNRVAEKPPPVQDDRFLVEKVLEFRSRPGTGGREYKVRWTGYGPEYDEWVNVNDIDSDLLENYWMYGNQQAIVSKRPVGTKAWGKRKTRAETLQILIDERERVLRTARQKMVVTVGDMQRLVTEQEKIKVLRKGAINQPLCRLGGLLLTEHKY